MTGKKIVYSCLAVAISIGVALPQEKSNKGLLQPGMEPTGGWTSQGEVGKKGEQTWTSTTVAAGVDQKPLAGKQTSVTGEIIDLSCYLQLGKHGDKHASCGKKCIANGQPIGVVTKAGQVYMLMEEEHDPRRDGQTSFRKFAGDNFAKVMTVTGTETTVNGIKAIYVQGYAGQ
jgi:hypothetical protein